MRIFICIFVVCIILYLLSLRGRVGHPDLKKLRGWSYAHRGLHGDGAPENSMEAFRRAKQAGYGVELDIHLLKDGNLAVIHDSLLKRTTGMPGRIEDLTTEELKNYRLEGTDETIPTFAEVLKMFDGSAPLIIELKEVGNCAQLCETACKMLEDYDGVYCVESFDPRCVAWLKRNRPQIIRGQLSENYFKSTASKLPWFLKFYLGNLLMNFIVKPDFVAYRYRDRKMLSNVLCRHLWGIQAASWTLQNQAEYDTAVQQGMLPIFENFMP